MALWHFFPTEKPIIIIKTTNLYGFIGTLSTYLAYGKYFLISMVSFLSSDDLDHEFHLSLFAIDLS